MGCGWTPKEAVDPHLIHSIEAVRRREPILRHQLLGEYLNQGYHITGIGGSDNHNAQTPAARKSAIGSPTTVIYANDLSVESILEASAKATSSSTSALRDRQISLC